MDLDKIGIAMYLLNLDSSLSPSLSALFTRPHQRSSRARRTKPETKCIRKNHFNILCTSGRETSRIRSTHLVAQRPIHLIPYLDPHPNFEQLGR